MCIRDRAHPAININDKVKLSDERRMASEAFLNEDGDPTGKQSKARSPAKGEAWGLAHHLQKVLIFLVGLRLRKVIQGVDCFNILYVILKVYREESKDKDVGPHYFQELLDYLHKTCLCVDKGSLASKMDKVDKDVLDRLKKRYPEVTEAPQKANGGGGGGRDGGRGRPRSQGKGRKGGGADAAPSRDAR